MNPWKPLGNRVIVRPAEAEEDMMVGSLHVPHTAKMAEAPARGEVVAVGEGTPVDGGRVRPVAVSIGDTVMYGKYAGMDIMVNDEELLVLMESDIIAHRPTEEV